jgi:hypothetical protein
VWPRWADVLIIVNSETVVGWHRAGFRLYWRWRFRPRGGRAKITGEIRVLIRRLAEENPDWGAPKIHGELQKLGFVVSERSAARYLRRIRRRGDPSRRWLAFLQNHREVIVAFDFFTAPTLTFKLLYCFFVIEHGRRRILHFTDLACTAGKLLNQMVLQASSDSLLLEPTGRVSTVKRRGKGLRTFCPLWNEIAASCSVPKCGPTIAHRHVVALASCRTGSM